MLGTITIAGIFYLIGSLISGKIIKDKVKLWKALASMLVLFFTWLWLLYIFYEGSVSQNASFQVGLGSLSLLYGLRSEVFLPADKKTKSANTLKDKASKLYNLALEDYKSMDYQEAIEKLLQANELQPNNKTILIGLAYNYTKIKEFHLAIDYMEEAIKYGYQNFDRIQTHEDFAELRKTELFQKFEANGYEQKPEKLA